MEANNKDNRIEEYIPEVKIGDRVFVKGKINGTVSITKSNEDIKLFNIELGSHADDIMVSRGDIYTQKSTSIDETQYINNEIRDLVGKNCAALILPDNNNVNIIHVNDRTFYIPVKDSDGNYSNALMINNGVYIGLINMDAINANIKKEANHIDWYSMERYTLPAQNIINNNCLEITIEREGHTEVINTKNNSV